MSSHAKAAKKFIADRREQHGMIKRCFSCGRNETGWPMMFPNGRRCGRWRVI